MRLVNLILMICLLAVSACAVNQPTVVPPTATSVPPTAIPLLQTIHFTTPDGAAIEGILYGSGDTVVIFSVMGNCKRGWEDMAELVAQHGMTALTYQWRGCRESGGAVETELRKFVDDLRGAINFAREQGAQKIILAGASLGGVASAKLAVEASPNALIVVAAPREIQEWDFEITLGDVNIDMPKLFITAENDSVVAIERSRELFDLVAEPKQWQTYPGTAHGTDNFETDHGTAMQQRILEFVLEVAAIQ
jgi:esterase/lipase